MLKKIFFAFFAAVMALSAIAAPRQYNKYGMLLKQEDDGTYTIVEASRIKSMYGINVKNLEDAFGPLQVKPVEDV